MFRFSEGSDGIVEFDAAPFRTDRFYVYLVWGEDRARPLYIGKANRPFTRAGHHLATAPWAGEIRSFECHAFLSANAALVAELEAIHELDPVYNVVRWTPESVIRARRVERDPQSRRSRTFDRLQPT